MAGRPDRAGPCRRCEPRARRPGVDRMSAPAVRPLALITGGAGFIATNVEDRLLRDGWRVRLFDNLSRAGVDQNVRWLRSQHPGRTPHGDPKGELVVGDVRDADAIRRAVAGVERVFHFAAQVAVTTSLVDP